MSRLPQGGLVDRSRTLSFTWDGAKLRGLAGDTLASALLANGVNLVGRSFKYHRPRGIVSAGPEEPNALVRLREGARAEPNTRATMAELFEGLVAQSQHRYPSLKRDLGAVANTLSPLFPAGFYYKTFMGAPGWMFYERWIRRAAGLGTAPEAPDPDTYAHRHAHCDVLVVGGGPAGLAAALGAGRAGARVLLLDERWRWGGTLPHQDVAIGGRRAMDWIADAVAELESMPNVERLLRTTAFGYWDQNLVTAVERVADHLPEPPAHAPRQVLWWIRARETVLATGSIERPLIFSGNDLPGVMLAGAVRAYAREFAVATGRRVAIFTNNDSGHAAALDLKAAGVPVVAVIDPRPIIGTGVSERARAAGLRVIAGHLVVQAHGRQELSGVDIARVDQPGTSTELVDADCLGVSGGWTPSIHLHSQAGGGTVWNERIGAFAPGDARQRHRSAGSARGGFALAACLAQGLRAGAEAAQAAGHGSGTAPPAPLVDEGEDAAMQPLWAVEKRTAKRFVDLQDDVTVEDIALAEREGFRSVEHVKRYTTLGMGTDQGKTSNVAGLAILAAARGEAIPDVGHTTFRPPYTPVTLGALAGPDRGLHFEPIRRTPMHDWHQRAGALMVEAGLWLRPRTYPRSGESAAEAIRREVNIVRGGVGLVDVSTLGKIDVQGPDAALFLDRIYANSFGNLAVGRARYGIMLREDGMVLDDGTCSRLSDTRWFMTTTTANAVKVMQHLEFYLQAVWPELRVHVTSVSEQWAGMALAGPSSRRVLRRLAEDVDVANEAMPHMAAREGRIAGLPARLFRLSFSGELAYEIYVPADYGAHVWEALVEAGRSLGIAPYGTEAMGVMRIEKGHVAGAELDGRTTADDLGLGRMLSQRKEFVGRRSLDRPGMRDAGRKRLVGLVPVDGRTAIKAGAQLVADAKAAPPVEMLGHVTSNCWSPSLGKPIALALLSGGLERKGQPLVAAYPLRGESVAVEVVDPVFVDPEGRRLHG